MTDEKREPSRRRALARLTAAAGGLASAGAALPFLASLAPSERAKAAGAPLEVDLGAVKPAQLHTVEWRGRPVWVLRRTPDMLERLSRVEPLLSDPNSAVSSQQPEYAKNATRSIEPELLVTVALCTHLGCIPSYYPQPDSVQPGWPGGFYCPCHGSKFDLAGRVYRGSPAPTNLVIPPHRYLSPSRILVGADGST
ncbi:MAG TPA: ubiquinol-cytochrome c reductase iron-sulfur subunit [Burkholderiales bacterium]|nr:ubiquinol-cytochrome c reductase iron-sulfur subunit [Burkholderiales bacterium]